MAAIKGLSIDVSEADFAITITMPTALSRPAQNDFLNFLVAKFGPHLSRFRFQDSKTLYLRTKRNDNDFKVVLTYAEKL